MRAILGHPQRLPALAVLALVAWLVALVVAPATLPPGTVAGLDGTENRVDHWHLWGELPVFQGAVYAVGDLLCHQKSWRTFEVGGNQLPVDERMTAIFVAALPGLFLAMRLPPSRYVSLALEGLLPSARRVVEPRRAARRWMVIVVVALLPAALDVAWENLLLHESNAFTRVITGAIAGVAGGVVLGAFLASVDTAFFRSMRRAAS